MSKNSILKFVIFMCICFLPISAFSNEKVKDFLFEKLQSAHSQQMGREIEDEIWLYWYDQAPTKQIRADLDKGRERREAYDFEAAENYFDKVVSAAPKYAEGYNQRAFARFLRENYSAALTDLETALELEPKHFGAMSGMYHILRLMNRQEAAMNTLLEAVKIHPWLKERGALPKDMQPPLPKDPNAGKQKT